jgi:hypothetical protein
VRAADVGDHGPPRLVAPAGGARGHGPPAPALDRVHPLSAQHLAAARLEPSDECRRELPGAALRYGETVLLAERAQHPAVHAAERHLGAHVRVQRVARQQPGAALAAEVLLAHSANREQGEAREPQELVGAQLAQQPQHGANRGEGGEEAAERSRTDALPEPVEAAPRVPVTGRELVQRRRGLVHVEGDHRAAALRIRMGDRHAAGEPAQAPALELEPADVR